MSTGERVAGGLEDLQREWRKRGEACLRMWAVGNHQAEELMRCAEVLAPHIAAAKEREEKLWALVDLLRKRKDWREWFGPDTLAAILGGKGA